MEWKCPNCDNRITQRIALSIWQIHFKTFIAFYIKWQTGRYFNRMRIVLPSFQLVVCTENSFCWRIYIYTVSVKRILHIYTLYMVYSRVCCWWAHCFFRSTVGMSPDGLLQLEAGCTWSVHKYTKHSVLSHTYFDSSKLISILIKISQCAYYRKIFSSMPWLMFINVKKKTKTVTVWYVRCV